VNILITGSINYTTSNRLKNFLHKIKEKHSTDDINIASRDGKTGIDKIVKRIALEFGFNYGMFNIYHDKHNSYSIMGKWKFNKPYSPRHYYWRDNDAVNWADMIILYCKKSDYKEIEILVKNIKKKDKKMVVVN